MLTPLLKHRLTRFGAVRLGRRIGIAAPVIGTAFALWAYRESAKRKGRLGGAVDTTLNAIPFVGAMKAVGEMIWGDVVPDRRQPPTRT